MRASHFWISATSAGGNHHCLVEMVKYATLLLVVAGIGGTRVPAIQQDVSELSGKLKEHFRWKAVDYAYPSVNHKIDALVTKKFVPENNLPVGIEIWKNKIFVTVPRWREGIPSTLNYVPLDKPTSESPELIPYPSWESNELGNCENGLTTVYRIHADACDRLWVLDTGTYGIENTTTNPCPYALNIFDLRTDTRILRYQFRPEDTNADTFIANIAVELGTTCDEAHAYFSDELGYGLIVYSLRENRSWRFSHSYFMPDPLAGDFTIDGLNFQWGEEGIFGMALSPRRSDGSRVLFFSPLASFGEFAVSTSVLHNSSRIDDSYHDFVALNNRGPSTHVTAKTMTDEGIMLFNLIDRNAIGCWNSALPYARKNLGIIAVHDQALIFPADVKIDAGKNVWVISDRMSNFLITGLNYDDYNFRILWSPLDELLKGTVCDLQTRYRYH